MVKTSSPLGSIQASGSLAKLLTYFPTRRQHAIRKRRTPRDPKSGAQVGRRAGFNFLTKYWTDIAPADKATWSELGAPLDLSNYNAYLKSNLRDWSTFTPPSTTWPVAYSGDVGAILAAPAAVWLGPLIQFSFQISPVNDNWGIIIFARPNTGFSTDLKNAVSLEWNRHWAKRYWTWRPPTAGPLFFNSRLFTDDGVLGAELGEFTPP